MILKKVKDYILNDELDLHARLFVLLSLVMLMSWTVTLFEVMILGGSLIDVIFLLLGIVLLSATGMLSVKFNRPLVGAFLISGGMCLLYLPCTFFFGGGIYGDAPLWFLFGIFFVNISLEGKAKNSMILMYFAVAALCWYLSYKFPFLILQNNSLMAHTYSFLALILISIAMSIMFGFRNMLDRRERERSLNQKMEIEKLNEAQNRFFSSMSHEIRTPINTIIALNEMILRENISDEVADDAANIQSASKMLLHLINDILDMSKLASGQMTMTCVSYNPGNMLSEIVGMLWIRAKEKNLELRVNVAPDIPAELLGDEVKIKQILLNVLNNAIKYTKEGTVSLSIQCGETENDTMNVIYTVSDTGIGIKKENIPYLFNAFKRVDEEKNRHIEGTGLGLSIVRQFVDLMGGKITVNSVYTKGTTFIIEIPQKIESSRKIGQINIRAGNSSFRRSTHVSKFEAPKARVLVVDDNASNLLVVSKLLRETKVKVETVSSGEEALKRTLNGFYHVIFMDHLMPNMDGIECFREIRSQMGGYCKDSKIVALTANAGAENRMLFEKEGFDGYLVKPITGDELEKELYRLLPRELTVVLGSEEEILNETISWMKTEQKKRPVRITTESVADLPQEIIEKYNVEILNHLVCTSEGKFRDGIEIETNGLLNYMKDKSRSVETCAPDVHTIEEFFAKQLTTANNIIHISISGKLNNSGCTAAKEAAKAFDNVTVIDSGHLSSGQGLMVIEACRLVEEGRSPEEITEHLEKIRSKIHSSFVVDNLDFLARAGQVSDNMARITRSLMARPLLILKKGRMGIGKVYFGDRERVWERYIKSVLRRSSAIDHRVLFVTYVGITKKQMEWIRERINNITEFDKIYFQKASSVIAVNSGEGTFGLLTIDAEKNI